MAEATLLEEQGRTCVSHTKMASRILEDSNGTFETVERRAEIAKISGFLSYPKTEPALFYRPSQPLHHISHGLGLGGDLPNINSTSDDVLQAGDTLSCEPGVYIPGLGGARIENMILITETGVEQLTKLPIDMVLSV